MINWYDLGEDEPAQSFDNEDGEDQSLDAAEDQKESVERTAGPLEPKGGVFQNVFQVGKFLNTFNQFMRGILPDSFRRERSKLQ